MTTFDERLRALVWGRELLEDLVADPSTPEERRKQAAQLLDGYPVASSIENRLEDLDGDALLPAVQRIEHMVGFLEMLQLEGDAELASRARWVARHYANRWEMVPAERMLAKETYPGTRVLKDAVRWAAFHLDRAPGREGFMNGEV